MLFQYLYTAGFFPIHWAPTGQAPVPGTTYVRPSARGVLRVFMPAGGEEIELYTGSLSAG